MIDFSAFKHFLDLWHTPKDAFSISKTKQDNRECHAILEKPVTKEQAIEIIVKSYNISAKRKLTKQEIEQNKEIERIYGDEFVQSCCRQAAIAHLKITEPL